MPKMEKQLMLLLILLSISFEACGVARPNSDLCIVNADVHNRECFNMARDYDSNGNLNPNAKATYKLNSVIGDLDKNLCIDPESLVNLKAYIELLRKSQKE